MRKQPPQKHIDRLTLILYTQSVFATNGWPVEGFEHVKKHVDECEMCRTRHKKLLSQFYQAKPS